ncbi:hypothetical protein P3447_09175 [Vibrio parahaemolyticus]|nr:hypothetical protein [Vibrio parahaemolyticus]
MTYQAVNLKHADSVINLISEMSELYPDASFDFAKNDFRLEAKLLELETSTEMKSVEEALKCAGLTMQGVRSMYLASTNDF